MRPILRSLIPIRDDSGQITGYANLSAEDAARRDREVLEILGLRPIAEQQSRSPKRRRVKAGSR